MKQNTNAKKNGAEKSTMVERKKDWERKSVQRMRRDALKRAADMLMSEKIVEKAMHAREVGEGAAFMQEVRASYARIAKIAIDAAVEDGVMTREEWSAWSKEYGLTDGDAAVLFLAYYGKAVDGDTAVVMTVTGSPLWLFRDVTKERFGVVVRAHE
jgi:hypothetical protein